MLFSEETESLDNSQMLENLFSNLNQQQADAVASTEGPLLVLAGAGTGKTKVLTSRIINIVNSHLASPLQILAVTFTNKAAAEMRKRIGEVIGEQVNNLWIGTFHSIAARILRRHPEVIGLRSDFTIIDDDDQTRLIKQILIDLNVDPKQFPAKNYLNKISRVKDAMAKIEQSLDPSLPKLKEVYEIYQQRLKSMNAVDFGDLLLHNLTLFQTSPDILSYYQDKFRYVLVDEYQDTNNTQYQWLLFLADKHKNICAVGDDDQSIYSWRGANVANILRFEKDFENAKVVRLEQNYRSSGNILKAADSVISNNKQRHGKTLWTQAGQGEKVKLLSFTDDRLEALTIANLIRNFIRDKKFQPSQIAVLVRAGYQTRSFEEAFIQNSLPYKVIGGMKFYERLEIRDAIAYLRICANTSDDLALGRIINVPKRGIGESSMSALHELSKNQGIALFDAIKQSLAQDLVKGKARDSLKFLVAQIEKFHALAGNSNLGELARMILVESGYIQMWKSENSIEAQGRIENIEEFIGSLADFSNMTEFLEYVSLVEARDDKSLQDAISIMTVHAAKGLEFDKVFVPGLEDGIFPSNRSIDERNGVEEERRLMYVAITRARKALTMSYAKSRYIFGDYQMQMPSRFVKELPEHEINFEEVAIGKEYGIGGFNSAQKSYSSNSYSSGYSAKSNSSSSFGSSAKNNYSGSSYGSKSFSGGSFHSAASKQAIAQNYQNKTVAKPSAVSDAISGKRVFHQKFGYGKVASSDGNKLEIEFEKSGRKTVMKDFVTLA